MDAYHLCLEEMDELFAAIAPLDWSHHGIRSAMDPFQQGAGLRAYQQENNHALPL